MPHVEIVGVDAIEKVELLDERVFEAATRVDALRRVAYPAGRFAEKGKVLVSRGRWRV